MRLSAALGPLALLLAPTPVVAGETPLQDYLARAAEAGRIAKNARDLMADGQSTKACAAGADALSAYARADASLARLRATMPAGAAPDPDLADYVKVVAAEADSAVSWRNSWCATVPLDWQQRAARAMQPPGAPDQPTDAAQAHARLAALDAEFARALKSAQFHLKAAYKEQAAGEGAQLALAANGPPAPGMIGIDDGKTKLWAACMDAGDARKRLHQARALLDEMRGLGTRFAITIDKFDQREAAVVTGLKTADGVCGAK